MEKKLIEKLQLIAECNGKTSNLQTDIKNGHGMCLDENIRVIKFNHILDKNGAMKIVEDIISAMREFGYSARLHSEHLCTQIITEYIIKY